MLKDFKLYRKWKGGIWHLIFISELGFFAWDNDYYPSKHFSRHEIIEIEAYQKQKYFIDRIKYLFEKVNN